MNPQILGAILGNLAGLMIPLSILWASATFASCTPAKAETIPYKAVWVAGADAIPIPALLAVFQKVEEIWAGFFPFELRLAEIHEADEDLPADRLTLEAFGWSSPFNWSLGYGERHHLFQPGEITAFILPPLKGQGKSWWAGMAFEKSYRNPDNRPLVTANCGQVSTATPPELQHWNCVVALMHEFCHVFAASHIDDESLMNPAAGRYAGKWYESGVVISVPSINQILTYVDKVNRNLIRTARMKALKRAAAGNKRGAARARAVWRYRARALWRLTAGEG